MQYRTHFSNQITEDTHDKKVKLCGWVHRNRDHGGVVFIDLRDSRGVCQLVFHPEDKDLFALAESFRYEYVIQVEGVSKKRPQGTENSDLDSGQSEIHVDSCVLLNKSLPLPFSIDDQIGDSAGEDVRHKYRYVDLRCRESQDMLKSRSLVSQAFREFLHAKDFTEVETPVLTKPTPEGAREYLVPSRTQPGYGFALQQSPQQFKQMLVIGGVENYYQIVKCFRDEDLRADRQPEFTQVDLEMSFAGVEDVISLASDLLRYIFKKVVGHDLGDISRISYAHALHKYGTDKPDLRNPLYFVPLDKLCSSCGFEVFSSPAGDDRQRVVGMRVPSGGGFTRKQIDMYTEFVRQHGAKGLAYIKINSVGNNSDSMDLQSPIVKFFQPETLFKIIKECKCEDSDILFFGAGPVKIVNQSMDALRNLIAKDLDLLQGKWKPVWVVDFPLFEKDETVVGKTAWKSAHHPFTAPDVETLEELRSNYHNVSAKAYDLVLNGYEIAGGSVRIHDYDMQLASLQTLGLDKEQAHNKFDHLLNALRYGAPPHAGIAFGLDRLMMIILNKPSIRDVIAFPKTQNASCLLTKAPSYLEGKSLKELGLRSTVVVDENKVSS